MQLFYLVVGKVDAVEEVEGGAHVLNGGEALAPKVELPLLERVGELVAALDQLRSDFHIKKG
jgi:hypothetical protein